MSKPAPLQLAERFHDMLAELADELGPQIVLTVDSRPNEIACRLTHADTGSVTRLYVAHGSNLADARHRIRRAASDLRYSATPLAGAADTAVLPRSEASSMQRQRAAAS